MGWEYKSLDVVEAVGFCPADQAAPGVPLNELGTQGWEMVGIHDGKFIFKRATGEHVEKGGELYPEQGDHFVLTGEERTKLEAYLSKLEAEAKKTREFLAGCGGHGRRKRRAEAKEEQPDPLEQIHACMTCDDFSAGSVDRKEGSVGGTCHWKDWGTNGTGSCEGWVLKGTPQEEKDRIRAALKESDDREGDQSG
jgi:hypothetical protein